MENMFIFDKNSTPIKYLIGVDERMSYLISRIDCYILSIRTNYFESIVYSIIGQQLSSTVANVLRQRFFKICGQITPNILLSCTDESLRSIGISKPKIAYIKNLSSSVLDGNLDFNLLLNLPDESVIDKLTQVKGIGRWTAEMFLIFSLGRLNVFSRADVGLQRAIKWLYNLDGTPTIADLDELKNKWDPYCTVASLYLWESVNQKLINK